MSAQVGYGPPNPGPIVVLILVALATVYLASKVLAG
jgi:hypothetical protein